MATGYQTYGAQAEKAALDYGLDPDLFASLITVESSWNPEAVSPKGAIGLGQLMPGTAKELGVNPWDPQQNLYGAAAYLSQQIEASGGDVCRGLAAYNAGPGGEKKGLGKDYAKKVAAGAGVSCGGGGVWDTVKGWAQRNMPATGVAGAGIAGLTGGSEQGRQRVGAAVETAKAAGANVVNFVVMAVIAVILAGAVLLGLNAMLRGKGK